VAEEEEAGVVMEAKGKVVAVEVMVAVDGVGAVEAVVDIAAAAGEADTVEVMVAAEGMVIVEVVVEMEGAVGDTVDGASGKRHPHTKGSALDFARECVRVTTCSLLGIGHSLTGLRITAYLLHRYVGHGVDAQCDDKTGDEDHKKFVPDGIFDNLLDHGLSFFDSVVSFRMNSCSLLSESSRNCALTTTFSPPSSPFFTS
jgi:hypothetical protein